VNLVSGADTVGAAKPIFDKISANLTARIAAAKTAGKGTTAAHADLDAMNAAIAQVISLAQPLPVDLLPLTPAQYNGGTAGPRAQESAGNAGRGPRPAPGGPQGRPGLP
jgi:hypothetical protein